MNPTLPSLILALAGPTGLRPAPGRFSPLPEYFSTTDRNALPASLEWAGEAARPPIGSRVDVMRFGIYLGCGTVSAYFHRKGIELGVLVDLDNVAAHLDLIEGTTKTHFYGGEIRLLDQRQEPFEDEEPAPGEPALAGPTRQAELSAGLPAGETDLFTNGTA